MIGVGLRHQYDPEALAAAGAINVRACTFETMQAGLVHYRLERSLRRAALPLSLRR